MKVYLTKSNIHDELKVLDDPSFVIKNKPYKKKWVKIGKIKHALSPSDQQNSKVKYWIAVVISFGLATFLDFVQEWRKEYRTGIQRKTFIVSKGNADKVIEKIKTLAKKDFSNTPHFEGVVDQNIHQNDPLGVLNDEKTNLKIGKNLEEQGLVAEQNPLDPLEDEIFPPQPDIEIAPEVKENVPQLPINVEHEQDQKIKVIPQAELENKQQIDFLIEQKIVKDLELEHEKKSIEQLLEQKPEEPPHIEEKPFVLTEAEYVEKLKNNELRLEQIPQAHLTYLIVREAVELDPEMFFDLDGKDLEFLTQNQQKELDELFKKNQQQLREKYFERLKNKELQLPNIPIILTDYKMCKEALDQDPAMIQYVDPLQIEISMQEYLELATKAIMQNSNLVQFVSLNFILENEKIKNYLGYLRIAKEGKGTLSQIKQEYYTPELLEYFLYREDDSFLRNYDKPLKYYPDHLKTKEMCEKAVIANGLNISGVPLQFLSKDLYLKAICPLPEPEQLNYTRLNKPRMFTDIAVFKAIPKESLDQEICDYAFRRDNDRKDPFREIRILQIPQSNQFKVYEWIPNQFKRPEWATIIIEEQPTLFKFIPKNHLTMNCWQKAISNINPVLELGILATIPVDKLKAFLDMIPREYIPDLKGNIKEMLDRILKIKAFGKIKSEADLKQYFGEYL